MAIMIRIIINDNNNHLFIQGNHQALGRVLLGGVPVVKKRS